MLDFKRKATKKGHRFRHGRDRYLPVSTNDAKRNLVSGGLRRADCGEECDEGFASLQNKVNRQSGRREPRGDATADRGAAHSENEFCNNYSVISTRLCLFNHNRHRALSMTCNPTPRPKFRVYFIRSYISICTITLYARTITPVQCSTWNTLHIRETAELTARTAGWPALADIADDVFEDGIYHGSFLSGKDKSKRW